MAKKRIRFGWLLSISLLILLSCRSKTNSLKDWEGQYNYSEKPILANAGYNMVMIWSLKIRKDSGQYLAEVEVNGQQTEIKIGGTIQGNEKRIAVVYAKTLERSGANFSPGDTLFSLVKEGGKIRTIWWAMEPGLQENPPRECECFKKE